MQNVHGTQFESFISRGMPCRRPIKNGNDLKVARTFNKRFQRVKEFVTVNRAQVTGQWPIILKW